MSNNNAPGMTVEQGNKLIAEFMGIKKDRWGDFYLFPFPKSTQRIMPAKMKYHSSWDWLMPVWKKLGGLLYERIGEFDKEQYSKAHVYTQHILRAFQTVEIETAFYLIVETIQWYNTQTPNHDRS